MVIVGTHHDVVREEFPPSFSEYLQQSIRDKFINVSDPEKCGFPRVSEAKNKTQVGRMLSPSMRLIRVASSLTKVTQDRIWCCFDETS